MAHLKPIELVVAQLLSAVTFNIRGLRFESKEKRPEGGSPGLVVMGDHSCSRGHGF